ncbi:hypothetical protein KKF91_08680, partial [Myxococcota bacterium]|nr:hypothetical protein [Myxococcota bacterium]
MLKHKIPRAAPYALLFIACLWLNGLFACTPFDLCVKTERLLSGEMPWTLDSECARVTVKGRQVFEEGALLFIKGVAWNPVSLGGAHPHDLDFAGAVASDAALMAAAGVNVVRTYEPITDPRVLDTLWAHGIGVFNGVFAWHGTTDAEITARIEAVGDHPAVLAWVVGNEWNFNALYQAVPDESAARAALDRAVLARIGEVTRLVKRLDPQRPVATIYGELPTREIIEALPEVDLWGLNIYRGLSFGDLFEAWAALSPKPMFVGEYGADAWDARGGLENQAAQAEAIGALAAELVAQGTPQGGPCSG